MEEFDLKRFAKTAWQKKWLIIAIMVISMVIGYCYSFFLVVPKYQSSTTIVLTKVESAGETESQDSITQTDITMNKSLVDTYSDIITSNKVAKTVIENLGLDMNEETLKKAISVTTGDTSAILKITVSNENAELAKNLTNEVAKVFSEQIKEIYKINNVNIIDEAEVETIPYNVHHVKDLAIFFVLGMFLSGGLILVIYMLDTTIKQTEDIENLKLQVIGIVPLYERDCENKMLQETKKDYKPTNKGKRNKDSELIVLENAKSPITEAFRTLRTNIIFSKGENEVRNILISSSNAQDGKSYVSANLATMFAKANKRVILVDADMRKGRQNKIFKVSNSQGLSNCLVDMGSRAKMELSQMSKYIKATRVPNLHVITSGDRPTNPAELLSAARVVKLLELLDSMYDIVIIDGTPSAIVSDSVAMSKFVDTVLIVASYKNTKIETLDKVKKSFENVGGKITGVVLNKYPFSKSTYTESYYYDDNKVKDKDIDQPEQIKSVSEIIEEATKNPKTRNRKFLHEQEETSWQENSLANIPYGESNQYLEYKIESISNELSNIKNLFIQAMMENNKVDPRDIADIKAEISNMKQMIDLRKDLDVSKEIRDEIESVKAITENLVDTQRENNEKVKKFIEEYRKRRG